MYNKLTPKQMEQLFCLQEECGEVIQAVSKILRHGYESFSPFDKTKTTNRENLERELGDAHFWIHELMLSGDLNPDNIGAASVKKEKSCKPFMHHQEDKEGTGDE